MKLIPLTKGKFAKVDDSDYAELSKYKWYCSALGYAVRNTSSRNNNKKTVIYMHRVLLQTPQQVDHKNSDRLDNRKSNLRVCSNAENNRNKPLHANNTSGYKGVVWHRQTQKWRAQLMVNGKPVHGGLFKSKVDAAKAYNLIAKKHFGRFAKLNKII
jgi:hypothetical protein